MMSSPSPSPLPSHPLSPADAAIMQGLLSQARIFLSQGHPSKALECVLGAVRHQRGEAGVFEVLNETRVAHGLSRLAVPPVQSQLPNGATHSQARLTEHHSQHQHYQQADGHEMEDAMSDETHLSSHAHSHSQRGTLNGWPSEIDETGVEALFRKLGVNDAPHSSHSQRHPSSSAFPHSSLCHPYPSAPSSSIHYPALRTVLPSLSHSSTSTLTLEEIHQPRSSQPASAAAGVSLDPRHSTPLLSLNGREDILSAAYDSDSSIICHQCAALIPKARYQAHVQYWCQTNE